MGINRVGCWNKPAQYTLGKFLALCLERPRLRQKPTPEQLSPIFKWTIRKTILRSGGQNFVLRPGEQLR
jgi:hypothetical protein